MAGEVFTQSQLEAIAAALGDTQEGLTGSEIGHLLPSSKMADLTPDMTKRHRVYNAFAQSQNSRQDRLCILAFIRKSMKPERYARSPERYEPMRANLNQALAFTGMYVNEAGQLKQADKARTLSEAQRRAAQKSCAQTLLHAVFTLTCSAFAKPNLSQTTTFILYSKR